MGDDTLGMTYVTRRKSRGPEPPEEPRVWRKRLLISGFVLMGLRFLSLSIGYLSRFFKSETS